jgi:hypothetical protein
LTKCPPEASNPPLVCAVGCLIQRSMPLVAHDVILELRCGDIREERGEQIYHPEPIGVAYHRGTRPL